MHTESEADLIAQCRAGESAAWDIVFDRHYAAVGRFVFQLGSSFTREDMEEITQETFLSAIHHIDTFQGHCQLQTWLFRIATNKSRDYREKQTAAKRGGGQLTLSLNAEDPDTGLTLDPPATQPAPDTALLTAENVALMGRALEQLGDPCREIVELRYLGDLSYAEISNALSLNEKTVSSRLSKCLDKLEIVARTIFNGEKSPVSPSNT
ncbi:MAG TPA: RNA polymerase sigma factor [Roseimicrobium sp.]|nr:RNA polymerase sigma factor [Roseimicrobium sp.]